MIKKLLTKLSKPKLLQGDKARHAHLIIEQHYQGKREILPPSLRIKGKEEIKGMFREQSYDWTVFRLYKEGNKLIFSQRHHVQHEGDCLKYLEDKTV